MEYESLDIKKTYLITGVAGFIGFFLTMSILQKGGRVVGIDNINNYYDENLKNKRLDMLKPFENFLFIKGDISEKEMVMKAFRENNPDIVINLAAQAGVGYSIENPDVYIKTNIIGFFNILEGCRYYPVEHLIYASSSSVYGANKKIPFEESDCVDQPVSLYAATKKSNELMAYTYGHLYNIPSTGLRFFTVYGPMGRPDMSYFSFTSKYFAGEKINIFNDGDFKNDICRDFTYIDDVVECITRLLDKAPNDGVPVKIYNIGNNKPEKLMTFIETLEKSLSKATGRKVLFEKTFKPLKAGDVPVTFASTDLLQEAIGFSPETPIIVGLQLFADWYIDYYGK